VSETQYLRGIGRILRGLMALEDLCVAAPWLTPVWRACARGLYWLAGRWNAAFAAAHRDATESARVVADAVRRGAYAPGSADLN
jgi:hypothetical protein